MSRTATGQGQSGPQPGGATMPAIAGLVLVVGGILVAEPKSIVLGAVVGGVISHAAMYLIIRGEGRPGDGVFAVAGLLLSYAVIVLAIVVALQADAVHARRLRCYARDNLRQVALAFSMYVLDSDGAAPGEFAQLWL